MGRKPKHPEIMRIEGKRSEFIVAVEAVGAVFVPDHLDDDAQACAELIKRSLPPAVLKEADSFALAAFAVAWSWHKRATHELSAPGFKAIVEGSKGQIQPNPWFKILKMTSEEMRAWSSVLGLNPLARLSLKAPEKDAPKSRFDGLIGQTASSPSLNA